MFGPKGAGPCAHRLTARSRAPDWQLAAHFLPPHSLRQVLRRSAADWRRTWRRKCGGRKRSEEHTSELQSHSDLVCRLLLEKKKNKISLLSTGGFDEMHLT